jgi:hypothetical protein
MSPKKEWKAAGYIMVGAGITFLICLAIGLLDKYHLLDPTLDFYIGIK